MGVLKDIVGVGGGAGDHADDTPGAEARWRAARLVEADLLPLTPLQQPEISIFYYPRSRILIHPCYKLAGGDGE